jgi:hypothetical protein
MSVSVSVDTKELTKIIDRFPKASAVALAEFTERVGRKVEQEAKYAMRADQAGPNQARSRTGNLVRQIRFINSSGIAGVVKAFANYSKYVHGQPFHATRGVRKTNPFFTTALGNSETYTNQEKQRIITNISRNL